MTEIDLCMSGSGLRLGGHVGGLLALEELGYRPRRIIATSGGAIVAGVYASGMPVKDIKDVFSELNLAKLRSFRPWNFWGNGGIYSNKKLHDYLLGLTGGKKMKEVTFDFQVCACDVTTNQLIIISKENYPDMTIAEAITVSASIPVYFGYKIVSDPKSGRKLRLMDGALIKNYPIDVLKDEGRLLVGLWIRSENKVETQKTWSIFRYLNNVVNASLDALSREHIEDAQWANTVPIVIEGISAVNFNLTQSQKEKMIEIGYNAVMEKLKPDERNY